MRLVSEQRWMGRVSEGHLTVFALALVEGARGFSVACFLIWCFLFLLAGTFMAS